jgi:hypothetical protein
MKCKNKQSPYLLLEVKNVSILEVRGRVTEREIKEGFLSADILLFFSLSADNMGTFILRNLTELYT